MAEGGIAVGVDTVTSSAFMCLPSSCRMFVVVVASEKGGAAKGEGYIQSHIPLCMHGEYFDFASLVLSSSVRWWCFKLSGLLDKPTRHHMNAVHIGAVHISEVHISAVHICAVHISAVHLDAVPCSIYARFV